MSVSAIIATYPPRRRFLPATVQSLLPQVDHIIVVANQFSPDELKGYLPSKVELIYPSSDLKDEGKFSYKFSNNHSVLLCDDDIIYPENYVKVMKNAHEQFKHLNAIIGVHGVIYSDFFDGKPESRIVHVFTEQLKQHELVNQLGTGTVFCRGYQLPPFEFMSGSARFVDLRFAVHCHRHKYARVCVAREANWMKDQDAENGLFDTFTRNWPDNVTREAQELAGLRYLLPATALLGQS